MKAKIHGIDVEGTPAELAEFKLNLEKQLSTLLEKSKQPTYPQSPTYFPPIYIGGQTKEPNKWNDVICISKPEIKWNTLR